MGALESNTKIVFFLNMGVRLPPFYIQLSQDLNYRDINLVPIQQDQIAIFLKQNKNIKLICSVTNFSELESFKTVSTGIIPSLIRQGRVTLYHFSSFDLPLAISASMYKESYCFVKLPEKISEICNLIESSFYLQETVVEKWPGGVKAGIPKLS